MKKESLIVVLLFSVSILFSVNLDYIDQLNHDGSYSKALETLQRDFDKNAPDPRILWRMSREIFELAEAIPSSSKKEKISKYTEAMDLLEPYLDITEGTPFDRASIVFFYASNFGSRGRVIGIKESLDGLPKLKALADRTLAIDPSFSLAYLLKAKIEEEVPFILGGDKFRMGVFFAKALQYDQTNLTLFYDAANALYNRNWDAGKKAKAADKAGITDPSPQNISDRTYAQQLLTQAAALYKTLANPSARDNEQYRNIMQLLQKLN